MICPRTNKETVATDRFRMLRRVYRHPLPSLFGRYCIEFATLPNPQLNSALSRQGNNPTPHTASRSLSTEPACRNPHGMESHPEVSSKPVLNRIDALKTYRMTD